MAGSMNIRTINQAFNQQLSSRRKSLLAHLRGNRVMRKSKNRRRAIRYGLLALNVVVLIAAVTFMLQNPNTSKVARQSAVAATSSNETSASPLDQLSSADIAAHVALLTHLDEANSVSNQADSVNDQLSVAPADNNVISKPQIVNTTTKTRKDVQKYVTQAGDTVSSLAVKFGVTSDSIRWSNGLTADNLAAGKELWISPISDGIVYVVVKGDSAQSLADRYHTTKDAIVTFNDAEVDGLPVGERIVIPSGTQPISRSTGFIFGGFAWGGFSAVYSNNGYDFGWCTWYAANHRAEIGRPVPSNLGNAYSWYRLAQRAGLPTGLSPQVGAVAVNENNNHVSVVELVNGDGSFWISEMNSRGQVSMTDSTPAGGWNRIDWKFYGSPGNLKFVY